MKVDLQDDLANPKPTPATAGGPVSHSATHEVLHPETVHPEENAGASHNGHPAAARHTEGASAPHDGHEKAGHHEEAR